MTPATMAEATRGAKVGGGDSRPARAPKAAHALAERLICPVSTAKRRLDKWRLFTEELVACAKRDPEIAAWAAKVVAPLAAMADPMVTPDVAAHLRTYSHADAESDALVSDWQQNPTPETEARMLASVERESARGREFVASVRARRT